MSIAYSHKSEYLEDFLKQWEKIEQILSDLIVRFLELLQDLLIVITPEKYRKKNRPKKKERKPFDWKIFSEKSKVFGNKYLKLFLEKKDLLSKKIRAKLFEWNTKIQELEIRSLKRLIIVLFSFLLLPILIRLKVWLSKLNPLTMALGISITALGTLVGLNIISTQKKLAKEQSRSIASESEIELDLTSQGPRPVYFNLAERFVKLINIHFPIYFDSIQDFRSMQMDVTLITSNRYIREYIDQNEYLFQDRLNVHLEPVVPDFPLNDEGRTIIREKIKYEVNTLLEHLEIKGEIEEVLIDYILGA